MKKSILLAACWLLLSFIAYGQDEEEESEKRSFKENLFTGGSVSLAFSSYTFLFGVNPVFGYSVTNWADIGLVANYTYTAYSQYDYNGSNVGKVHQSLYGGGGFVKLYPFPFIFVQAQYEKNIIRQKVFPPGFDSHVLKGDGTSFLVGGGYCSGRMGRGGDPFFYMALLADVGGNYFSPYTNGNGDPIIFMRCGVQFPLFQKKPAD